MRTDLTDITIVLDRSGSMGVVRHDTIGGFNQFLQDQRALADECHVSLVQFDDIYEPRYEARPIAEAPPLDLQSYQPRGFTALLDAIGLTIQATGQRFRAMPEEARPAKVLFVIITDGMENASTKFSRDQVFKLIGQQRDQWKWDFVFIGCNQDAIAASQDLNLGGLGKSMSSVTNSLGLAATFAGVSSYTARSRAAPDVNVFVSNQFTASEYAAQVQAGAKDDQKDNQGGAP